MVEICQVLKNSDTFYILNLKRLESIWFEWQEALPDVRPYYAVKCNPDPRIINTLAILGSNFDCASRAEIDLVLKTGVSPARILYANPCKRAADIQYAREVGVSRTTFDSVCELKKMAAHHPDCELMLRIRADDPGARCNLGVKYGAEEQDWDLLLFTAKSLGLSVVGVSFHVGSFASSSEVFDGAIKKALQACDLAREHGYCATIIDMGGGFSAEQGLPKCAKVPCGYELIAEPGRFFAEQLVTLYTPVIGIKGSGVTISESVYGFFNCIKFDHASPQISKVIDQFGIEIQNENKIPMTIFGSTCDGGDIIGKEFSLPENICDTDWIVWDNMGAYTVAATTTFNGFRFNSRMSYSD